MFEETYARWTHKFNEKETDSTTLFSGSSFVELRNALPSRVAIVSAFVDKAMRFISIFRDEHDNNLEIELALREALVNAIVHGNKENPAKRVRVRCRCTEAGEVAIAIEDEGQGFEYDAIADCTLPEHLLREHGRGIYLIRTLMDDVHFEQGGSVICMSKRAHASDSMRKPQ